MCEWPDDQSDEKNHNLTSACIWYAGFLQSTIEILCRKEGSVSLSAFYLNHWFIILNINSVGLKSDKPSTFMHLAKWAVLHNHTI